MTFRYLKVNYNIVEKQYYLLYIYSNNKKPIVYDKEIKARH